MERSMTKEQNTNFGGSLLPSGDPLIYVPMVGRYGTFETRPCVDIETHALMFARNHGKHAGSFVMVAIKHNGYSCAALARRIIEGWETGDATSAIEQFEYILECGGLGIDRDRFLNLAEKGWSL